MYFLSTISTLEFWWIHFDISVLWKILIVPLCRGQSWFFIFCRAKANAYTASITNWTFEHFYRYIFSVILKMYHFYRYDFNSWMANTFDYDHYQYHQPRNIPLNLVHKPNYSARIRSSHKHAGCFCCWCLWN